MRSIILAAAALLAAAVHAQAPQGKATETGKTQPAACQAAGVSAASMAQGNEIALKRSDGRSPSVSFSPCECVEKSHPRLGTTWTCTRRWSLVARQR